jgi:hypothetical protein
MNRFVIAGVALVMAWSPVAQAVSEEERLVVGVVSAASPGRMVLILDRDGYRGQHRGTALTLTIAPGTRVFDHDRPVGAEAIRPRQQATVTYVEREGALVAREVGLRGMLPPGVPLPGQESASPSEGPSRPAAGGGSVRLDSLATLTEVRIQKTNRQGDAAIDRVRAGTEFYIAFYVRVEAKGPVRLAYRCLNPDFDKATAGGKSEALKILPACTYEETVPAGFHGIRFRAFPMKYARQSGSKGGADVIVAEMAPVVVSRGSEVRAWQRKLSPVTIEP